MDGQDQAPSESPELKPPPEDYRQQTFEKTDLKAPAKSKLTKLKMPSQSVEVSGISYLGQFQCEERFLEGSSGELGAGGASSFWVRKFIFGLRILLTYTNFRSEVQY